MVSLKLLFVLALIVAVTCEPCHIRSKGRIKARRHKRCRAGTDVALKGGLRGSLKFLFKGLRGHCKLHKKVFRDLINIKLPKSFDGSLRFLLQLGLGIGSAVDLFIPGLGDLLSRLIGLAIRLLACFLGLLGDREFCGYNDYDSYFGISFGGNLNIDLLFKKFRCHNARSEIDDFINKSSNGKGISFYTGSRRTIIDIVYDIFKIVNKKKSCVKNDLTFLIDRIITLTGLVGNGFSQNLGNGFADQAVDIFDNYLSNVGAQTLSERRKQITVTIKDSNTDDFDDSPWGDLSDDGGDDGSDDSAFDDTDDDSSKKNNNDDNNKKKRNNDDDKKRNNDDDDDKKKNNDDSGNDDTGVVVKTNIPLGDYFLQFVKPVLKGKGRCRVDRSVLNYLIGLKAPKSFEDVARLISNLSIVVSSVVDTLIPGLGKVLGKIFLYLTRGSICIKGSGYTGFCGENYVRFYDISSNDADSLSGLAKLLDVLEAKKKVLKLIKKHTKGKSVKTVIKGAQKTVLLACVRAAELADKFTDDSNDWEQTFSKFFKELMKIIGTVANSYDSEHKLGNKIIDGISTNCDSYVQKKGIEAISSNKNEISESTYTAQEDATFQETMTTTTTTVTIITTTETVEENQSSTVQEQQS